MKADAMVPNFLRREGERGRIDWGRARLLQSCGPATLELAIKLRTATPGTIPQTLLKKMLRALRETPQ
jgi:hypothetical protein